MTRLLTTLLGAVTLAGSVQAQVTSTYPPAPATSPFVNYRLLISNNSFPVPAGVTQLLVCGVGAGGGGGGVSTTSGPAKGTGGFSGDFYCALYTVTSSPIAYTNSAGGAGGVGAGAPSAGGAAMFGTLTFNGGPAGVGSTSGNATVPSQSLINLQRSYIIPSSPSSGGIVIIPGTPPTPPAAPVASTAGAPSPWGAGGAPPSGDGAGGNAPSGYGGGGAVTSNSMPETYNGGNGSASVIVVRW